MNRIYTILGILLILASLNAVCIENDGFMNIFFQGITLGHLNGELGTYYDYCDGQILNEYVCIANNAHLIELNCSIFGLNCIEGRCTFEEPPPIYQCTDSDGGIYPLEYGYVLVINDLYEGMAEDFCVSDKILHETYCEGIYQTATVIDCRDYGLSCVDGQCQELESPEFSCEDCGEGYLTLGINDVYETENYKIRLDDISTSESCLDPNDHPAVVSLIDSTDTVIEQTQICPGMAENMGPDDEVEVSICKTAPGITLESKWACVKAVEEIEEEDNIPPEIIYAHIQPIPALPRLGCYILIEDEDDELINVNIKWYRNNEYIPEHDELRICNSGENCQDLTIGVELPEGECDKWECEAIAFDGDEYSDTYLSEPFGNWDSSCEEPECISDCTQITESGYYILCNDIEVDELPEGNKCIDIRANDVTLDCLGYEIIGIGRGGIGIYSYDVENMEIRNCEVSNWRYGFLSWYTTESTIHNNIFKNNRYGIQPYVESNGNTISFNQIIENENGILLSEYNTGNNYYNNYACYNEDKDIRDGEGERTKVLGNYFDENTCQNTFPNEHNHYCDYYCREINTPPEITDMIIQQTPSLPDETDNLLECYVLIEDDSEEIDVIINWYLNGILQGGYEVEGICETGTLCDLNAIYPGNNPDCSVITCEAITFDGEYSDTGLENWENECPGFCEDSDGGPIITIFGITTNETGSYEDICISRTTLTEYYCIGEELRYLTTNCPTNYVCENGRCIRNEDSLTINLIIPENDTTVRVNEGGAVALMWEGLSEESEDIEYTLYVSCETNMYGGRSYSPIYTGYTNIFLFTEYEDCEEYMYWYVVANDGYQTKSSNEWRFKIEINYPPTIELLNPENGEGICGNLIEFVWEGNDPNEDELEYTLHILQEEVELITYITNEENYITELDQGIYTWYVSISDGRFIAHSEQRIFEIFESPSIILINPPEYSWVSLGDTIYFELDNFDYRDWGWDRAYLERDLSKSRNEEFEPIVPYTLDYGEHNITIRLDNGICELQETFIFNVAECWDNSECAHLDNTHCSGDLIITQEGVCNSEHKCVVQSTDLFDCNSNNKNLCEGTWIMYEDYTCSNEISAHCVINQISEVENCDDGIYCDGQETCSITETGNPVCLDGTPVDCSANNLLSITTCTNNPDANPFTWDFFGGFTSTCNEDTESCTIGTIDLTHTCSVEDCDAECDAENDCEDTYCEDLSDCVGNHWYEYSNVPNDCLGDCTCTENECTEYTIFENDERCVECITDEQCTHLTTDYCLEDSIMHDEGVCINYECAVETTETQDCNSFDIFSCSDTWITYEDYTCNLDLVQCTLETTIPMENCDNEIYCDGQESCLGGECQVGIPIDCSTNNLASIETCFNNPDANPFTWDFFGGFTSTCNEDMESCTIGTIDLTHTCSVEDCDAECDAENDCTDTYCEDLSGCVGNHWYEYSNVPNDCLGDCTCTDNECTEYEVFENDYRCTNCYECEDHVLYIPNGIEGEEINYGGYTIIVDEITEQKIYFKYSYLGTYLYRGSVSVGNQITDTPHNPEAPSLLTHVCDVREVGTEDAWGCFGFDLVGEMTCEIDDDCIDLNTNYCNGDTIMQNEGRCLENICVVETTESQNCNDFDTETCEGSTRVFSDHSCFAGECINELRVIQECDNGIFCDGQESCTELLSDLTECQVGIPIDCSANNLLSITTCTNNPDANPFTWDFFGGFTSTCNEDMESCTIGTIDLTHTCSVEDCDAECDAENDCTDTYCEDLSGCVGNHWYEYSNVPNDCLGDCTCTDNGCTEYTIFENDERCELRECVEPYAGMIIMEDTIFCEGEYEVFGNISVGAHNIVIEGNNTTIIGRVWYENEDKNSEEEQQVYSLTKAENRDEGDYLTGITIKNIKWINRIISVPFTNNLKIQNNILEGYSPIFGQHTINSEITNNTINAEGIYFLIAPLDFMNSENVTIERNIISISEDTLLSMGSILLLNTHNSIVRDNTIECIGEEENDGIYILGNTNEIYENSVTGCKFGLFSNGAYENIIENNYLCGNDVDIILDTSTGNNLGDNMCDTLDDRSIYGSNTVTCSGCVMNLLTNECIDSDEGYDIYTQGETTYLGESRKDNCRDELSLFEYFCDANGIMRYSIEYCPLGHVCIDGACTSILNTDKYIQTKDGIEKIYEGYNKQDTYSIKPSTKSSETSPKTFKP